MRAFFIVLLGCSLIWLVLQGFRRVQAGDDSAEAGVLLPAAPFVDTASAQSPLALEPSTQPASLTPIPSIPQPVAAATVAAAPTPDPPKPQLVESVRGEDDTTRAIADESEVASLLARRPRDISAYLDGDGRSLPPGRRALVRALQRVVLGPVDEARRMADELESQDGVRVAEIAYVKQALSTDSVPVVAASGQDSPLLLGATMARLAQRADAALAAGKSRDAALALGEWLLGELSAPWKADRESLRTRSESLARAQAGYRWNPDGGWSFVDETVREGDSLISIRKRAIDQHPNLLMCTGLIERANALRGGVIHPGQHVRIPTSRASVLVDLDAHWALFRLDDEVVAAWEIGVGKPGTATPPGEYRAGEKTEQPMWFRPGQTPVPFGDPENPLGTRWIAWQRPDGTATGLGFHGTKDPESIGDDQSQGCVRMRRDAIEELFEILPRGARIIVQP